LRSRIGEPVRKTYTRQECQGIEEVLRAIETSQLPSAIPYLHSLLDARDPEIPHWAANALLGYTERAALSPLSERSEEKHRYSAVAATFKLDPDKAFERYAKELEKLREAPKRAAPTLDAVFAYLEETVRRAGGRGTDASVYSFARHELPTDILERDPRWRDACFDLAHVSGRGLELVPVRVLVAARDHRRWQAYVNAMDGLGFDMVAAHLRFLRDPQAGSAIAELAKLPHNSKYATKLRALAAELRKAKKR
jgi:hypothetical protein